METLILILIPFHIFYFLCLNASNCAGSQNTVADLCPDLINR